MSFPARTSRRNIRNSQPRIALRLSEYFSKRRRIFRRTSSLCNVCQGRRNLMALNAFLKIVGKKSGEVRGSVSQKGREGRILVIAADHTIVAPSDPQAGVATG